MSKLNISHKIYQSPEAGNIANLILEGVIDQKSVPIFESTILELYRKGISKLVLDFSKTMYLNSTGLGLLINIAHKVNLVGGGVRLINVPNKFRLLFDMLGLESCLPILTNYKEAIESFGAQLETLKPLDFKEETENDKIEHEQLEKETFLKK